MCRIAAYIGPEVPLENIVVHPKHSLLVQSQNATEAKLSVNGDGFGFAWYAADLQPDPQPGLYRDVLPAWSDGNLVSLCRMIRSRLFIAHVRASTMGETARANCHPFSHGTWSFCHNGQVPHFRAIRRRMEAALPDPLYEARQGSTDSEMLFLTLLANGLDTDPAAAIRATLSRVGAAQATGPVRMTCVFSDGTTLYAFRHASDHNSPTLYASRALDHGGFALASEPLCGNAKAWRALTPDTLYRLSKTGDLSEERLFPAAHLLSA
ncbi:MAG: class II glutamine amidotransferase [Rhodobacteraceae bacterium]|nr:class II glutamine amidotransferase [Paracoccaceae bacterium]